MAQIGYIQECECKPDFQHPNGSSGKVVNCVSLDHYITECSDPPIALPLAVPLYNALSAVRYGSKKPVVSVTMLTRCPLELYYKTHSEWVDKVLANRFMLRGTFAHEGILADLVGNQDWIVEEPRQITLDTPEGSVVLYGTPDAVHRPAGHLYDLKTQQEYSLTKKNKQSDAELRQDPFVRDNIGQVNCYYAMLTTDEVEVNSAELLYMDGKLRVRRLPVELVEPDQTIEWMSRRAGLFQRVLDGTIQESEIPNRRYDGWSPVENGPVWVRVKAELDRRKVA